MSHSSSPAASADDPIAFIAKPTAQLRAAIDQQRGLLPPADLADLVGAVRSAFEKYTAKLLSCASGVDRATVLHRLVDRELAPAAQFPITCRKGCTGCCHYEVEVTVDEAEILADLVRAGYVIDKGRLRRQASRERKSPEWMQFGHPDNRCVFLGDDGGCGIYEQRPAICRKHLVTSPAEACTTAGGQVVPIQLLLVEILLSAALSLPQVSFASMSKMLLPKLGDALAAAP